MLKRTNDAVRRDLDKLRELPQPPFDLASLACDFFKHRPLPADSYVQQLVGEYVLCALARSRHLPDLVRQTTPALLRRAHEHATRDDFGDSFVGDEPTTPADELRNDGWRAAERRARALVADAQRALRAAAVNEHRQLPPPPPFP